MATGTMNVGGGYLRLVAAAIGNQVAAHDPAMTPGVRRQHAITARNTAARARSLLEQAPGDVYGEGQNLGRDTGAGRQGSGERGR